MEFQEGVRDAQRNARGAINTFSPRLEELVLAQTQRYWLSRDPAWPYVENRQRKQEHVTLNVCSTGWTYARRPSFSVDSITGEIVYPLVRQTCFPVRWLKYYTS